MNKRSKANIDMYVARSRLCDQCSRLDGHDETCVLGISLRVTELEETVKNLMRVLRRNKIDFAALGSDDANLEEWDDDDES